VAWAKDPGLQCPVRVRNIGVEHHGANTALCCKRTLLRGIIHIAVESYGVLWREHLP
jgi:hypothetical protein